MALPSCGTITSTSTPLVMSFSTSLICTVSSPLAASTSTLAPSSLRALHEHVAVGLPAGFLQRVERQSDRDAVMADAGPDGGLAVQRQAEQHAEGQRNQYQQQTWTHRDSPRRTHGAYMLFACGNIPVIALTSKRQSDEPRLAPRIRCRRGEADVYLGIDVGTSAVKAVLIDSQDRILAQASAPLNVVCPRPLWSEQDPQDWWVATTSAVTQLPADLRQRGRRPGAQRPDARGSVARRARTGRCAPRSCGTMAAAKPNVSNSSAGCRGSGRSPATSPCRASRRQSCCGCATRT